MPRWGSLSLYQRLLRTQTITQQAQERFGTQGRPRVDCLNGEMEMLEATTNPFLGRMTFLLALTLACFIGSATRGSTLPAKAQGAQ